MNKQSDRKEASSSIPNAPRKPLKNGASSEEVRPKEKNVPDEKKAKAKAKAKATPAKTGKNSASVKKTPDKSAAKSGSN